MKTIKIYNKSNNPTPSRQTEGSSGMDLYANIKDPVVMEPYKVYCIPTGIHIELPIGFEAQIRARSGLALKNSLMIVNGVGTIDSDYRGEISAILMNLSHENFTVSPGDRIAQMVISKYERPEFVAVNSVDELSITKRGTNGYGSTGVNVDKKTK